MERDGAVLIVDDDNDILMAGKLLLKRHFLHVTSCNQPEHISQLMTQRHFDAILLDMNFGPGESSGQQGYAWLERILSIDPQAVVVMITAHGNVDTAVEAMKLGATDFISKPWQNEKMVATISSAISLSKTRREANQLRSTNKLLAEASGQQSGQKILGNSHAIQQVMSLVQRSAPTDANVLILGENGTGKELVARELHARSLRAGEVFMSVDLGAISESLFESELFGHKKGAFTGANTDRVGRLKAADNGTLFLDEIGNLPLHLQGKLLTVLAQRQVIPLGTNTTVPFNVRVLAATNVSKQALTNEKYFRQDLLFRLNTVEITLPPLRERADDIEAIANFYIDYYSRKYTKERKQISNNALHAIRHYHWPGNIRALRHAIERAVILSQSVQFDTVDFQLENSSSVSGIETHPSTSVVDTQLNDFNLENLERTVVTQALKTHHYNISHTAKALGLTRAALYRRMEKYGL